MLALKNSVSISLFRPPVLKLLHQILGINIASFVNKFK